MGLMFSPVSGALSSKNTGGRSGLQRENTGTSFHNHNIGTAKCCPSETTKFPHMWRLQLNRDEAQQPSGKLIDVFISKVGISPGGQYNTGLGLCFSDLLLFHDSLLTFISKVCSSLTLDTSHKCLFSNTDQKAGRDMSIGVFMSERYFKTFTNLRAD